MFKPLHKKFIILLLAPLLFLALGQSAGALTRLIGGTATITVNCSDIDGNLSECNVTSPCIQNCSVFGSSASCSCQFTCSSVGEYDACGQAKDLLGQTDLTCLQDELKCVTNRPPNKPEIPDIYKPSGVSWSHCTFRDKSIATLHWTYSDPDSDPQTAYEVEVDDNSAFQAPKFNNLVNLAATAYVLDLSHDDDSDWISELEWNTTYFWRVRVKDDHDNWSEWSNSHNFKTPKHAYPWTEFSWLPTEPSQGEVVIFDPDASETFGGSTISAYLWSIIEGDGVFIDETSTNSHYPHILFSATDNKVKLEITDSDGYSCSSQPAEGTLLKIELPLPEYKEVSPISWLKKVFAGIVDFFDGFF